MNKALCKSIFILLSTIHDRRNLFVFFNRLYLGPLVLLWQVKPQQLKTAWLNVGHSAVGLEASGFDETD